MTLVIGIGNPMRGDDGVGAAVLDALNEHPDIETVAFDGDGIELMVLWEGCDKVIVVDATQSDAPAGTITRYEAHAEELPQNLFRHSTHQFGVVEAVEMARTLGQLPGQLTIIGIEGAGFDLGAGLSDTACVALGEVVHQIQRVLECSK